MSLPGPLHENCPLRQMFDLIGDRWTSVVIYVLSHDIKRYSELQRHIPGISKKMLTQTLRSLERDKLLIRKVYPVTPPKTEYQLTPLGLQLLEPINGLSEWAQRHEKELKAIYARRKKDSPEEK